VSPARGVALGLVFSLGGVAAAAAVLHARDRVAQPAAASARQLYLHSGPAARRAFLTFDALAADVYWMRTIQHYGRDRKSQRTSGRFELLQPLIDLTTTLDPHFNLAYRFGAIFLAMEPPDGPGRPDEAIALLEKGLAANPSRWQYAHDIGFVHYWHTGDYRQAALWFEKAAAMPGAPSWIRPLAALTLSKGGDRAGARALLNELRTSNEAYIRQAAERFLAQLQTLDRIDDVQARVNAFHAQTGRWPASLRELAAMGRLPGLPVDPTGTPLALDRASHRVVIGRESPLSPLPAAFARR
jgi:tetratricopeptide (TPR) repeat protein